MHYKPRNDYVLLRVDEPEDTSRGGSLLPEQARSERRFGVVIAVGDGKQNDSGVRNSLGLEEGQRVVFNKFGGHELGDRLLLIKDEQVMAIIND